MATGSELLTRAVSNVTPRLLAEEKLKTGKPLRVYFGIDPTGSLLHIGHSVPLLKMREFQDAGHHVTLVIGSFTAMIGDPSGRDEMRTILTEKDVKRNFETYMDQAKLILDVSKLEVQYNHEWLEKLTLKEVAGLARHFTVQQMLERDMFKRRMGAGNPITILEFLYPIMVGYDSVVLDVDCELGGNDQYFNMLAGRTLQTALKKRDKFVLTTKLIEGTDGRKMSKTYNNCIYITDTPKEMYGRLMSIPDTLITLYMECCTRIPTEEVKQADADRRHGGTNPRDLKMRLAREIVTMYHDTNAARQAEDEFIAVFRKKGLPDNITTAKVKPGTLLIDVLVQHKLVASKNEARRLIEQGGVKLNDEVVRNIDAKVDTQAKGVILKVGKRKFLKIE